MATYYQEALQKQVDEKGEIVRWLFLIGVAVAALMEVVDTSITNVALPHIQGNLGSTTSEAAWVVTSYAIANIITMPLAVMFGDLFGKKRYFIFSMIGFTLASIACGMATSLTGLVLARVAQGLFGGGLLAKAQGFLFEAFPPEKQGLVQAVFGICVIVGPVMGPTLGGWLTDNYNWRWIFFINIPIGIFATILCQMFIPKDKEKAIQNKDESNDTENLTQDAEGTSQRADGSKRKVHIDWLGIAAMSVMLGCLQYVLEKGQDEDWFSSHIIIWNTVATVIGAIVFFWHELRTKHPAVNLRIVRFKSVAIGLLFQGVVGFVLFGVNYVIPSFAQIMLGYTALDAGKLQVPSSIVTGLMFPVVGALVGKLDARIMVGVGITCLSVSSWFLTPITLAWGWNDFLVSSLIRGFGLVLVFMPLTIAAVGDCPPEDIQTASSLLSLVRTLGGSVGIALITTILMRREDFHRAILVEKITPYSTEAMTRLSQYTNLFQSKGFSLADAKTHALAMLSAQVDKQALSMAFADIAFILCVFTALTVPFIFLLTSGKRAAKVEMH